MRTINLLAAVSTVALSTASWAQTSPASPAAGQKVPPPAASASDQGEIIVTAQRRQERLQDVPLSVSVQSGEQLLKAGVTDSRGLAQLTPGLTMQQQSGYLNPSLRGVSTSVVAAGAENPIAIYLDGIYVSSLAGSIINLPDIDHIEVLKGPQGTLFGRNATGGAIQVFSKQPSFTPTGKVDLNVGAFDGAGTSRSAYDLGFQGYVSGPIVDDKIAGSIAFSEKRSNGYATNIAYKALPALQDSYGTDRMAKDDEQLIRGKLLFTPTDNLKILATGYYTRLKSDRNQIGYALFGGTATTASLADPATGLPYDRITGSKPWQYAFDAPRPMQTLKGYGASLKIDLTLDPGTITSTTGYSWTKNHEEVDSDQSYAPACLEEFICPGPTDSLRDRNFSQELLFTSRKFGHLSFVTGANYYHSNSNVDVVVDPFGGGAFPGDGQFVTPPIFTYNQTVRTNAVGLFAEANYDLTDKLTLIAGIRYSHEKKDASLILLGGAYTPEGFKENKFTPRVSLRYAVDSHSNVYATFSQGFKSGVIPAADPTAKPTKPEQITAYEVGFKTAHAGFSLNIAAFYYDYKDLQVQSSAGFGGTVLVINNAATARIYGLDVDGSIKIAPGLSLRGGISWLPHADYQSYPNAVASLPFPIGGYTATSVIDLSHTRLYKTPKITATAGATYETRLGNGKFSLSPNVYYASRLYVEASHLVSTTNFKLGAEVAYEPDNSPFRFSAWVKNATNNHAFVAYQATSSALAVIPGDPREEGMTISYKF
jgi:iron complex outermembrane receptor protein